MSKFYQNYKARMHDMGGSRSARQFMKRYYEVEEDAYAAFLRDVKEAGDGVVEGMAGELAERYGLEIPLFAVWLDGLYPSLQEEIPLNDIEEGTRIRLNPDLPTLFYNMVNCKADYLYSLKEWDALLSQDEREKIHAEWNEDIASQQVTVPNRNVGRNDPCPCGSGKKYKKCCWDKDHAAAAEE